MTGRLHRWTTLVVLAALFWAGCDALVNDEKFDKAPNLATEAPPEQILTGAQVGSILLQDGHLARISGVWTHQFTGSDRQFLAYNEYRVSADDFTNMWNLAYQDIIGQTRLIRAEATETNNRLLRGVATITEALASGTLTALFGDIPFSQAAQPEQYPNPAFDPQPQVYEAIQQMLGEAIADLQSGAGISPGSRDIFFGADADKWIKVAHTLRARYYLHTGNYAQALQHAQMGIDAPDGSGDLIAPHGSSLYNDANPFYLFVEVERSGYMTANNAFAPSLLDPASSIYRGNAKTDESARFAFYYAGENGDYVLNTANGGAFAIDADFPIVTYVENQLIIAEAALLANGDFNTALAALNNARAALDQKFGPGAYQPYAASDFEAGGIANPQGESPNRALLREILEEKYLSLIGNIEAFNDARRTDNFIGIPIRAGNRFPQRFLYGLDELNANENAPNPPPGVFEPTTVNAGDYPGLSLQ
ncbi:hypothetical protein RmaAA213_26800 [Rhodothermus marinus]|nr:hypothetical protein RmaAA213_26800 [Rhodothermus marinus]BBM73817.1 hypothetical protein RmaAA338_26820 [Rhodothermus marinus]